MEVNRAVNGTRPPSRPSITHLTHKVPAGQIQVITLVNLSTANVFFFLRRELSCSSYYINLVAEQPGGGKGETRLFYPLRCNEK